MTKPATAITPAIMAPAAYCWCAATAAEEVVLAAADAVDDVEVSACPDAVAVAITTEVMGAMLLGLEAGADEDGLTAKEELDCLMGALDEEEEVVGITTADEDEIEDEKDVVDVEVDVDDGVGVGVGVDVVDTRALTMVMVVVDAATAEEAVAATRTRSFAKCIFL